MRRSKTASISLEEAKARFEEWSGTGREGFHTGRVVGIGCRGGPEGRREPNLSRVARGMESPEAAMATRPRNIMVLAARPKAIVVGHGWVAPRNAQKTGSPKSQTSGSFWPVTQDGENGFVLACMMRVSQSDFSGYWISSSCPR
jgi:hypothetical protein